MIEANLIHNAHKAGVEKLIFLGSSCFYPKLAPQPLKEEYLLSDYLEFTNEPYAIAKIAGIKLCENYFRQYCSNFYSVLPTNLYGPNDNFDLQTSHVLPAFIRKFHEVKEKNEKEVQDDAGETPVSSESITGKIIQLMGLYREERPHIQRMILVSRVAGICFFANALLQTILLLLNYSGGTVELVWGIGGIIVSLIMGWWVYSFLLLLKNMRCVGISAS